MGFLRDLFKHKHNWKAIKTIWPYPDGYGVYCAGCNKVVDTGLSKKQAQTIAKEMNEGKD